MTRSGKRRYHHWTVGELAYLRRMAGEVPEREICGTLRLGRWQVEKQASRLGLSLSYRDPELVWCDTCGKWRTELDEDGLCPVCAMERRIDGHRERYRDALDAMTPAQRAAYLHAEAADEQAGELAEKRRDSDRWKKRVQAAREVTGSNPRKGAARE